jgi:hypothetical protein
VLRIKRESALLIGIIGQYQSGKDLILALDKDNEHEVDAMLLAASTAHMQQHSAQHLPYLTQQDTRMAPTETGPSPRRRRSIKPYRILHRTEPHVGGLNVVPSTQRPGMSSEETAESTPREHAPEIEAPDTENSRDDTQV